MAATVGSKMAVNGVDIYYKVKGTGPNVIVCIPGAFGTVASFVNQVEHFRSLEQ